MKKQKLKIEALKVQSFVTGVKTENVKGASNLIGACVGISAVDCVSNGVLSPCLTGNYPTLPVLYCVGKE